MQQGSGPDLRRRFQTGRPSLDLVHTGGEGVLARFEIVETPDDLGRLIGVILGLTALPADAEDLAAAKALRGAVTRMVYALAEGSSPVEVEPPRPDDRAIVNAAAARPPLVFALDDDGGAVAVAPTVSAALASIARDAVELCGGPLRRRIRVCGADDCGLLLLDTTRAGTRRWCSMEFCGNRSKVRTHRART